MSMFITLDIYSLKEFFMNIKNILMGIVAGVLAAIVLPMNNLGFWGKVVCMTIAITVTDFVYCWYTSKQTRR